MNHRFQCRCGALHGVINRPHRAMRAVCYCRDCQTYAHVLGQQEFVLDPLGGTDIVATQAADVSFTSGIQTLACLSLSPRGLLRWYAKCCGTPIANTPRDWKLSYVGLVHTCLRRPDALERSFPAVQLHVNTKSAKGTPPAAGKLRGMARFAVLLLRLAASRLSGGYRATHFFHANGKPVVEVMVVPPGDVEQARRAVG